MSSDSWSERLAVRYQCIFSPALTDWFDSGIWQSHGCGEYCCAVDPALLLADAPEPIWPGLMSCDLIPVIGNTSGDWLCVRVGENNEASEVVQWYHGGGDWIPWGRDIAQAIVFDGLIERISSDSRRHAIPAIAPRSTGHAERDDGLLNWAFGHMADGLADSLNNARDSEQVAACLLDAQVSEVAIHCELILKALCHTDVESLQLAIGLDAESLSRNQLTEWVFDHSRIPDEYRQKIFSSKHGMELGEQNWSSAASHARAVTLLAPHLAWGWEIVGYCEERSGHTDLAIDAYDKAARCSVFTDQSVRLNTHWATDHASKFSIERMCQLDEVTIEKSEYLSTVSKAGNADRRSAVTDYWKQRAVMHLEAGEIADAYECYMAAGWDLGAGPITVYGEILERVHETATQCGQSARAELAATHRRCLRDRYGI
ncbi:MAG TPA: hypothetical protein DEF45_12875 [Rhodopirellula sp.]|nr:MAG: hypothetical protein CBD74_00465 [Saprospirales bacterium TMED214]HBV63905.1 hypothetical protein [Rhodopirellula sp.]